MLGRNQQRRRHSLLDRYGGQLGELVERQRARAALETARQNAETAAEQTRAAMKETERANRALRDEMSERLKVLADLEFLANHDALTSLANRNLFNERLDQVLDRAKRTGESVALMILDVDHFKDVNDTLGHHVGDELLRVIGERISGSVRTEDTVARLGGDEFAIIQVGLNYPTDADVQAQRILHAMAEPVHVGNHKLIPMGSIGITVFPSDADNAQKLQQNADLAMYRAKQDQRSSYRFFDADLNSISERRTFLEKQLRNAIDAEELAVFFQPKVSICDGKPVGAEALLRWPHPEQGMIPPSEFVPIAEKTGMIAELGEWTLAHACRQFKSWHDTGYDSLVLAVNLSAAQFSLLDVPAMVRRVTGETGFDPSKLEIEVTETAVMSDMHNAVEVLTDLRDVGVNLSIDDFGTGYSSLSYLRQLPINRIKIDRRFIAEVETAETPATVARAVVNLGQSLGLEIVAEGVESDKQLAYLQEINCDQAQGHLFSAAMPADQFEQYLKDNF